MKRIIGVALVLVWAMPALAQEPRQIPSGAQFLQSRIAEDSATIAQLLDRVRALEAEIAKRKTEDEAKKPAEPKE